MGLETGSPTLKANNQMAAFAAKLNNDLQKGLDLPFAVIKKADSGSASAN